MSEARVVSRNMSVGERRRGKRVSLPEIKEIKKRRGKRERERERERDRERESERQTDRQTEAR